MFKIIEIDNFQLLPPNGTLEIDNEKHINDFFELFSIDSVTAFNKNYELKTKSDAQERIVNINSTYINERSYTFRLYDTSKNKLIGTIELVPPHIVNDSHGSVSKYCFRLGNAITNNIWIIEYYLAPDYWRKGIMSKFVLAILKELFNRQIKCVVALCHQKNDAANKFVAKLGFICKIKYDRMKHHNLWIKTNV